MNQNIMRTWVSQHLNEEKDLFGRSCSFLTKVESSPLPRDLPTVPTLPSPRLECGRDPKLISCILLDLDLKIEVDVIEDCGSPGDLWMDP